MLKDISAAESSPSPVIVKVTSREMVTGSPLLILILPIGASSSGRIVFVGGNEGVAPGMVLLFPGAVVVAGIVEFPEVPLVVVLENREVVLVEDGK